MPIHPEYVARILDEEASPDAIFTADTGMCCSWIARYITPNGRRRLLGSFVHGTMANALPQAIGAQYSFPNRQVVSMSGDGGLAMLLGELLTVRTHKLPLKVIVFNNSSLGMVRLEMMVAGDPPFETDHDKVDFAAIARAVGFYTVRVEQPQDVRDGMKAVLSHDGPALLDVVTDPNALELPPHLTIAEAKGFALSMGRTVLAGGVGNILELARTNSATSRGPDAPLTSLDRRSQQAERGAPRSSIAAWNLLCEYPSPHVARAFACVSLTTIFPHV